MHYIGTYFCDIDGTLVQHGTTTFLPGAKEFLQKLRDEDFRIIFVTRRGDFEFKGHPAYSKAATEKMLRDNGLDDCTIIYDVMSPRFIVDDSQAFVLERDTNIGFTQEEIDMVGRR